MIRFVLLAMLLGGGAAGPVHATVIGRYLFRAPDAAHGAPVVLVLEREGARVLARRVDGAIAWQLGVDAAGPRPGMEAGALPPCARLELAVQPRDLDGDGLLDRARGESLQLFVTTSVDAGAAPAVVAALDADAGSVRLRWRRDGASLPVLSRVRVPPTPARIYDAATRRPREVVVLGSGWPSDPAADPRRVGGTLLVLDAATGLPLPAAVPRFEASLGGGVTAVDLDADGLADRLYLADAAGRVWRIELPHPGAAAARWHAQLLADLSAALPPDQAFLHAPDVVRLDSPARLAITVGSSDRETASSAAHWLFQLPDTLSSADPVPVAAAELPLDTVAGTDAASGFRRRLAGSLAAPLLTVDGTLLVATRSSTAPRCRVGIVPDELVTVTALDITGPLSAAGRAPMTITLPAPVDAPLVAGWTDAEGEVLARLECRIGDRPLPLCPRLPRLQREWWRRGDAP